MNVKDKVAKEVVLSVKNIFGKKLKKVILYGSYARGDYDAESDIDFMVLADIERESIPHYRPQVYQVSNDVGLENNIFVSMMLNNDRFFFNNLKVSNFYRNVMKDGKVLYDR